MACISRFLVIVDSTGVTNDYVVVKRTAGPALVAVIDRVLAVPGGGTAIVAVVIIVATAVVLTVAIAFVEKALSVPSVAGHVRLELS